MYRFQRSGQAKGGKFIEAAQFAKEVAEYFNSKYAPASLQVYANVVGDYGVIYWHSDIADLATFENVRSRLLSDQKYWEIVVKGTEWFIEGSFHDVLMGPV